jgi:DNA-binding XRE family transcriptional regulator
MRDPIIQLIREVRVAHEKSQQDIADCMGMAKDHYRHIEAGRRSLPDLQHGLTVWIRSFEDCAQATPEERRRIYAILTREIIIQVSVLLPSNDPNDPQNPGNAQKPADAKDIGSTEE